MQTGLIVVASVLLTAAALRVVGGWTQMHESLPDHFFHVAQVGDSPDTSVVAHVSMLMQDAEPFPWIGVLLGYPWLAMWFTCTPALAAILVAGVWMP